MIDGIQKLVEKETEINARKAEEEWKAATSHYRVQALSAAPGVNVQPTAAGIEVRVRYITPTPRRKESARSTGARSNSCHAAAEDGDDLPKSTIKSHFCADQGPPRGESSG